MATSSRSDDAVRSLRDRFGWQTVAIYTLITTYMLVLLVPLGEMFLTTLQSEGAVMSRTVFPRPNEFTLDNYVRILTYDRYQMFMRNSLIISFGTTAFTLLCGIPAAYALSRFDLRGGKALLLIFLTTKMLPAVLILIPFFGLMWWLGLVDTHLGVILAHSVVALPLVIWLMKSYFDDIPRSLDDAAKMDGCSDLRILTKIILPLAKPGIAVSAFWAFVTSWNDYLFVSIISRSQETRTLAVGLQMFQDLHSTDWAGLMTGAVIMTIPLILLFSYLQDWIMEGISSTGTGGVQ